MFLWKHKKRDTVASFPINRSSGMKFQHVSLQHTMVVWTFVPRNSSSKQVDYKQIPISFFKTSNKNTACSSRQFILIDNRKCLAIGFSWTQFGLYLPKLLARRSTYLLFTFLSKIFVRNIVKQSVFFWIKIATIRSTSIHRFVYFCITHCWTNCQNTELANASYLTVDLTEAEPSHVVSILRKVLLFITTFLKLVHYLNF